MKKIFAGTFVILNICTSVLWSAPPARVDLNEKCDMEVTFICKDNYNGHRVEKRGRFFPCMTHSYAEVKKNPSVSPLEISRITPEEKIIQSIKKESLFVLFDKRDRYLKSIQSGDCKMERGTFKYNFYQLPYLPSVDTHTIHDFLTSLFHYRSSVHCTGTAKRLDYYSRFAIVSIVHCLSYFHVCDFAFESMDFSKIFITCEMATGTPYKDRIHLIFPSSNRRYRSDLGDDVFINLCQDNISSLYSIEGSSKELIGSYYNKFFNMHKSEKIPSFFDPSSANALDHPNKIRGVTHPRKTAVDVAIQTDEVADFKTS